jgi:phage terminase large subunit
MPAREFEFRGGNLAAFEDTRSRDWIAAGPAGTGKTIMAIVRLLQFGGDYPGARMLIVRNTRKSLTETALATWENLVLGPDHPILVHSIQRGSRHHYDFPNGSILVTAGMDDPGKVFSSEWDLIFVNEATEINKDDWETLNSRLRAMAGPYDQLFGDCNPTSPHHWLWQRVQAGLCRLHETFHWDNPRYFNSVTGEWTVAGRRYIGNRLAPLTGTRRERFLLGKWVAAEGCVYDYDPRVHLLPANWKPDPKWPRVWGIDWGKTSPTVLGIWAVDEEGRMYLVREYYKTHLRPDRLAKWVLGELETGREPTPRAIVCDHDPERKEEFEKACRDSQFRFSLEMADKTDRDKGIEACQARFDVQPDGKPRIFFRQRSLANEPDRQLVDAGRPTCGLEEMMAYVWDENELKDEPIADNDHLMDMLRYSERWISTHLGGTSGNFTPPRNAEPLIPRSHGQLRGPKNW